MLTQRLPTNQAEKLVLSGALQHGFVAVLIFALIALAATFFLKDVPLVTTPARREAEAQADEEDALEVAHS
jgi:hypothetical protein